MTGPEIFRQNILRFHEQLNPQAVEAHHLGTLQKVSFDAIITIGMGGSGTPGKVLQNIANYDIINIPILNHRDGVILPTPFRNPLYIVASYSGNTRESCAALKELLSSGKAVAVVAGGGALLQAARRVRLPHASFTPPDSLQPRQGYGLSLMALIKIVQAIFPAFETTDIREKIAPTFFEKDAAEIAPRITKKTTLVYSTTENAHIGEIFKISIAESGKSPAFANLIPEVNHNELNIIGPRPGTLHGLFITTEAEYAKRRQEFDLTKEALDEYAVPSDTIVIPGKTRFEETIYGIIAAQWLGYYVAGQQGEDPLDLALVTIVKNIAKKKGL